MYSVRLSVQTSNVVYACHKYISGGRVEVEEEKVDRKCRRGWKRGEVMKETKEKELYKSLVRFFELHCTKYHVLYLVTCGVLCTHSARCLPCSLWGPVYTQ